MSYAIARAYRVADELLHEQLPRRWSHVCGVADRARLSHSLFDDSEQTALTAAAILHDVGYSPEIACERFHSLDGARYLIRMDIAPRIVALVAHHSCAYKEAELRGLSAELAAWVDEETPLRDALWWADMTTSPDGETVSFDERIKEIQERYGQQDVVTFFVRQAEPELRGAVERTEARLRAAGIDYE